MPKFQGKNKLISYSFPKSEEIIISRSDLQIQLQEFKKIVNSSFSIFDLLSIISLWSPVFANAFISMLSVSAGEIRAGYIVLAIFLTVSIVYNKTKNSIILLFKNDKIINSDPKIMSKIILDKCQPKTEK